MDYWAERKTIWGQKNGPRLEPVKFLNIQSVFAEITAELLLIWG